MRRPETASRPELGSLNWDRCVSETASRGLADQLGEEADEAVAVEAAHGVLKRRRCRGCHLRRGKDRAAAATEWRSQSTREEESMNRGVPRFSGDPTNRAIFWTSISSIPAIFDLELTGHEPGRS